MPESKQHTNVMHLIDTLDAGGAEGVAVALANEMVGREFAPHLCTTRREGPLSARVRPGVGRLALNRRRRVDMSALRRLQTYLRRHNVRVLHAHSTSLFTAVSASFWPPFPHVVWHDHYGGLIEQRGSLAYRLFTRRVAHVITVNESLAAWAHEQLGIPANRVHYVPNFVSIPEEEVAVDLPGEKGYRIVCVANLREQKDHVTLIQAMACVVTQKPRAHLLLVGNLVNKEQVARIQEAIRQQNLADHVTLLGVRNDVAAILQSCDIGVLSSISEGLPLALLEYGAAKLPAISTDVGQCKEVLDFGKAGLLVSPRAPAELAEALLILLRAPEKRLVLAKSFYNRVQEKYSATAVMRRIEQIYRNISRAT